MSIRDFDIDLKLGGDCEAKVIKEFRPIFAPIVERIYYKDNPILQKKGVDGIMNFQPITFDTKCRRFQKMEYVGKDILLETVSVVGDVVEQNKPGWVYYTESPVVAYFWLNKNMSGFLDGYILYMNEVRKFFIGNEDKYYKPPNARSQRYGRTWQTENRVVKIKEFPLGSIQHISKEVLTSEEQVSLSKFMRGFSK